MNAPCRLLAIVLFVLALCASAVGGTPAADEPRRGEYLLPPLRAMGVTMEVLVDGLPARTVRHAGKVYLPVERMGAEYTLRVVNHGPRRILAVLSVDGLSVISGKPASSSDLGYIVEARSRVVIPGWRRSLDTVAAFRFTSREDSYAARTGRPENVGVIGMVAYEEMAWPVRPLKEAFSGGPARAKSDVGGTGTGYGRDIDSRAIVVPFVRGRGRVEATIWYDTVEALRRAGVPVDRHPVPFPRDLEFAPPPPR